MRTVDEPVSRPLLTDALVSKIHAANEEAGQKERAFPTSFRHSDAGGCARKLAYAMLELETSNPPDLAGEWVMGLGTIIHELVQEALHDRFGSSCEVEVKVRHGSLSSGHIDAVIKGVPDIGTIAYELKTKGGFGFDKAIGINRKAYALTFPEGPGSGAQIQGALNAAAVDADLLVIGVIGLESISKQLAARVGFDDLQRFIAEWHYPKSVYLPWASQEITRFKEIEAHVLRDQLPDRIVINEHAPMRLNPNTDRPAWQCVYCAYAYQCIEDGPGNPQFIREETVSAV